MDRNLRNILLWLLVGSKGGRTRVRILRLVMEKPVNVHKVAKELGLNYRTAKYHLGLMLEHGIVEKVGEDYGAIYVPSHDVEESWDEIEKLIEVNGR
ncbi:winged helix-turn-helix domain-containing protein [Thermococcus sp.]|uniref:ArsR/SmtB family transcription factor n=1 Tax=Thermococcus sp. TaxID=35749 RepID=UPI0025FE649F|nr:winged helix-turn-helix domain-containing protein [Thermococcus sp.]